MKHQFEVNIYLIGFMGSGKSTIAPILAKKLNRAFLDIDQWIENETGKSISNIFAEQGEKIFRQLEIKYIETVSQINKLIVAVGGGAVLHPKNWLNMKKSGVTVYFQCTPEILSDRIKIDETRPLLTKNNKDRFDKIENMLKERAPYYDRADIIIEAVAGESADHFTERLIKRLEEYS